MANYMGGKPLFIRKSWNQYNSFLGATGQETPGDAAQRLIQAQKVHLLQNIGGGRWQVFKHEVDAVVPGEDISIGYYDPEFIVRFIKLFTDGNTYFSSIVYDLPHSARVFGTFGSGVMLNLQVVRIWLGEYQTDITANYIWLFG
jgi:hypothetical protein